MGLGFLAVLLAILLPIVLLGALQIEDWRRDLTTNWARTDASSTDPLLRPPTIRASTAEAAAWLEGFAANRPAWKVVGQTLDAEGGRVRLERTTRLWRFVDDVEVTLARVSEGVSLEATSRSRVGKGDLGQNPRNLRELLAALRADFPADGAR